MARFLPIERELKKMGFNLIAGMDEVGRGPLAGPVVSAAVILKENARLPKLKDSKALSKVQREVFFQLILKNSLDYAVAMVPPAVIDRVNIYNACLIANDLCLQAIKIKPDFVLVDGRDKQIFETDFQTIIKGDMRVRSIAAASIIAKVFRDRLMTNYSKKYKDYGFERHVGYSTRFHRKILSKIGPCEIHRKSFKLIP